ncbi:hypothetical protein [Streptomyces sp. NPDC001222]|uniref:hypothetical protein n=1 Tax=Streptomyces sp. NPDC001222 TaxID=3364548 RepID=UPI00368F5065
MTALGTAVQLPLSYALSELAGLPGIAMGFALSMALQYGALALLVPRQEGARVSWVRGV